MPGLVPGIPLRLARPCLCDRDGRDGHDQWEVSVTKTMQGGCHCGRVRFRVIADLDRVTECNCSMCSKKGFLHLIVPRERFELISGEDDLTIYQFNTKVAQHMFCKVCGIHSFYVPRSDPDKIDVNVRCLDNVDLSAVAVKQFDGKNWEAAMQRRVPWR
jgi:hypothetical protein